MPRKTTIDTSRFAPIKGDPKRNYVDKQTGQIVSRRQATQQSLGGTSLEKRAKQNKQPLSVVKPLSKLPRKQKVKYTTGKVSDWRAMKATNLAQVKEICKLLPPGTIIIVKAKGIPSNDTTSPTLLEKGGNGGKRKDKLRWGALGTQFPADQIDQHMGMVTFKANKNFEEIDFYHVMAKLGGK